MLYLDHCELFDSLDSLDSLDLHDYSGYSEDFALFSENSSNEIASSSNDASRSDDETSNSNDGRFPDNFMDLSDSEWSGFSWHAGSCADTKNTTLSSSNESGSGGATVEVSTDKLPQTEFEKSPVLEYKPLPKSESDPTSLGKNK